MVYIDHDVLRYLLNKSYAKPQLTWWVLLLYEFNLKIREIRGFEDINVGHLSHLKNPSKEELGGKEIKVTLSRGICIQCKVQVY